MSSIPTTSLLLSSTGLYHDCDAIFVKEVLLHYNSRPARLHGIAHDKRSQRPLRHSAKRGRQRNRNPFIAQLDVAGIVAESWSWEAATRFDTGKFNAWTL